MVKSRDNPSSIFFWKDYENDAGLRISSLAAQGLWMRLLCVAAKAEPYGYILINGIALDYIGAARIAGVTESEAESLMLELERNGVFSRDRRRRPFSRRMVKEGPLNSLGRPSIPLKIRQKVWLRDQGICQYCGCQNGPFHFDHVKPWSRGGKHTVKNLVVACVTCNLAKGARTPKEMGWHRG